jgi:hypothetical protein
MDFRTATTKTLMAMGPRQEFDGCIRHNGAGIGNLGYMHDALIKKQHRRF